MTHSVTACAKHQVRNTNMCHPEHHGNIIITISLSYPVHAAIKFHHSRCAEHKLQFSADRPKVNAAAGFGGNAESLQPAIGGAQTKLRLDSMEKFFCSQGLASPIEPPGAHAFTSLHSKSNLHLCFVP